MVRSHRGPHRSRANFRGFHFSLIWQFREKHRLSSLSLSRMEANFRDSPEFFGAEIEEDEEFVHYAGLKLGAVPEVWGLTHERAVYHRLCRRIHKTFQGSSSSEIRL